MLFSLLFLDDVQELFTDLAASFFVGDAAGRHGDHASTDRKWALNIGISFWTPEVIALNHRQARVLTMIEGVLSQSSTGGIQASGLQCGNSSI